jgi:hypothetical protein
MRAIISISAVMVSGISLSGCVAYEVASTAVDATTSVVSGVADVAGDVVTAPFGKGSDKSDKN